MKTSITLPQTASLLFAFAVQMIIGSASAQVCSDPTYDIFGLNTDGHIRPVALASGATGAVLNAADVAPSHNANALGYNANNGRFYFFKRNINSAPQSFVSFDPVTGITTTLTNSMATGDVRMGCVSPDGTRYYCIDAHGSLYLYRINFNTWTVICNNIRDESNVSLASIIATNGRVFGDMTFDGSGNLWIVVSGASDYGLFRIASPVPISFTTLINIQTIIPATTVTPEGAGFGGLTFNTTSQLILGTNTGNNKLYRLETDNSLTYLSTVATDGMNNDLTSCNFPMFILSAKWKHFSAQSLGEAGVQLRWSVAEHGDTDGYLVEQSADGKQWHELTYTAKKPGSENSYVYIHYPETDSKLYYRIRSVQRNGNFSLSPVKLVDLNRLQLAVWPNPVIDRLYFSSNALQGRGTVSMTDQAGNLIYLRNLRQGVNHLMLDGLKPGIYFLKLQSTDGAITTQKILKRPG